MNQSIIMGDIDYIYFNQLEEKWDPIYRNLSKKSRVNALKLMLSQDEFNNCLDLLDRSIVKEYKQNRLLKKKKYKSKSTGSKFRFFNVDFENYLGYLIFIGILEMNLENIKAKKNNENVAIEIAIAFHEFEKGLRLIQT